MTASAPSLNDLLEEAAQGGTASQLWLAMGGRDKSPSSLCEFVTELQKQAQWAPEAAIVVGHHLIEMATQHRRLCAMEMATGLEAPQKAAWDALEAHLEALAQDIPGVTGTVISGDPRGSTMGLRYASGAYNSLNGGYMIPTDEALYARLERTGTPFWDRIPVDASASTPAP